MSYKGGFVVNIVRNGNVVNDENGAVALPFGCEYKLRLKNKNTRDAVAKVFVDGRDATSAGDLIIHAGEDSEIERFIDSIRSGRKFKFISVDGMSESEKNNPNNGIVEIRFRLKKEITERVIYYNYPSWITTTTPYIYHGTTSSTFTTKNNDFTELVGSSSTGHVSANYCCSTPTISDVYTGKTVEGSHSSQSFGYSYIGELEDKETIIKLKIVGYTYMDNQLGQTKPKIYCSGCGKKTWDDSVFCSSCGNKL